MTSTAAVNDYRAAAKARLPRFLFEYLDGGSFAEVTLGRNTADLQSIVLRQRVLKNVSELETSTSLFGQKLSTPVILAPVGLAGMYARRGEVQAANAAAAAGVPFTLSTVGACSIEEVASEQPHPFWFQLYMIRDRGFMRDLLERAEAARCPALVFTVDMPVPGSRYRDYRSGLAGAPGLAGSLRRAGQALMRPRWAWDVGICGRPHSLGNVAPVLGSSSGLEDFFAWMRANFDPSVTWDDLEWVRDRWTGPLIVKGILDPDDAVEAANIGADGIVVSNHGGRQLDGALSAVEALPAVVQAVGSRLTVLADGGARSGLDIARFLALGARGVMIGRPWVYALAASGINGVAHILQLFRAELLVAMALTGCTRIEQIDDRALARDT